jgi:hypothetical protein
VRHKNNLATYLSDRLLDLQMLQKVGPGRDRHFFASQPKPFLALSNNSYDLSLMLKYLDSKLITLENKQHYKSYSECIVFLKSSYIFYRILLDTLAAVIEFLYKKNESINLPNSFKKLISKYKTNELPTELSQLIKNTLSWFPEFKSRRDDLVHNYQTFLIHFGKDTDNLITLEHSYTFDKKVSNSNNLGNIREYLGFIFKEYPVLVDGLLDHFDSKFHDWYGIVRGYDSRTETILEGTPAYMIWWTAKYGNYKHDGLFINDKT